MQKRVSKGGHEWWGRPVQAGETLDVEEQQVTVLLLMGWIEPERGEPGYVAPAADPDHRAQQRSKQKTAA